MKKSKSLSNNYFIIGVILIILLVSLFLIWPKETNKSTGKSVVSSTSTKGSTTTKSTTPTKSYTTSTKSSTTTTKPSTTTATKQSTTTQTTPTTNYPLTREKTISTTSPNAPPVRSFPQPAPGDQNSDVQGVPCTTCAKQYEYRTVMAYCGGVDDWIMYEDPGIDATCIRSDPYNDYRLSDGNHVVDIGATARCRSGKIISYGAKCPYYSTMTELRPTIAPAVYDADFWTELPLVDEVGATCDRISALPSEEDNAIMYIHVTCMREKTS